jgi:hypothetical protein
MAAIDASASPAGSIIIRNLREEGSRELDRGVGRFLKALRSGAERGRTQPLVAAISYYKNHGATLFRFIDEPLLPIENSPTEREFQNVVKLRFNTILQQHRRSSPHLCFCSASLPPVLHCASLLGLPRLVPSSASALPATSSASRSKSSPPSPSRNHAASRGDFQL